MARTKHTPKNPHLHRPVIAKAEMFNHPEKIYSRPQEKEENSPESFFVSRLLRKGIKSTGGIKKPHRYRPGLVALRKSDDTNHLLELIKCTPFKD